MRESIPISEIFGPTVQGEGPLIGRPTVFVRAGGCDYRCVWCDTLYAVLPERRSEWALMTPTDIERRIDELASNNPELVTLSGGNPALQPLAPLIELGHAEGHTFALETQGSVSSPWFRELDWLILSPKPPSSHMITDWDALDACISVGKQGLRCVLKIVVFDDADYSYARTVSARYPALPVYLQVGNAAPLKHAGRPLPDEAEIDDLLTRFRWLVGKVTTDRWFAATVLPQLSCAGLGQQAGRLRLSNCRPTR